MGVPTLALQIIFEYQTPKAMEQPPRNVWFSLGIQSNDNQQNSGWEPLEKWENFHPIPENYPTFYLE